MENPIKTALAEGRLQRGIWLNLPGTIPAELAGKVGFDWCLIDGEHGPWDPSGIRDQLIALKAAGTPAVVRVPMAEAWVLKQVLDLGADTVLVPMIDTAEQAEAVVAACRYPPDGTRGMGAMVSRAGGYGAEPDYVENAQDRTCILVQVESNRAMENLEAICAVPGLDGVFIGPADLGADMGFRDDLANPDLWAVIEAAIQMIRRSDKAAGILVGSAAAEARMIHLGVTFLGVGSDAAVLRAALSELAGR